MPRKEGQKRKLLALLEILTRETDETHPLSVPRLVELLEKQGVNAERKSIYDDIDTLNDLPGTPYNVLQQRGRGGGYYMEDTPFELAELKLLVDAVYASKFITAKKTKILIEKLGKFTSRYHEQDLDRTVLVSGRVKSQEEKILYSVDALHRALTGGVQVSFKYCDWSLEKKMVPRRGGVLYQVSPWALVWENGNYYLIAYEDGKLKNYRVDKMQRVEIKENAPREGAEEYAKFDVNAYTQQMFNMYSGCACRVVLRCEKRLVGAMLDRFGTEPSIVNRPDSNTFDLYVTVQPSPQFYGWVAGFGGGVEIVSPPDVRAEMRKTLDTLQEVYR